VECRSSDLRLTIGSDDGATGHYFTAYSFTNVSASTCVTQNFPGVQYLNKARQPMEHKTHRGGGFGDFKTSGPLVRLRPHGRASFELEALDFNAAKNKACPTSSFIAVYPPDQTQRIVVSDKAPVCGDTIYIAPMRKYKSTDAASEAH
jgi:hypothetical protein